ncbi:MAG TPA: hypothetical protein VE287_11400, partial [Actinopolymorphaceae bacterium]|nr:hypothetical protein [Actinopolymorphaceae bacterium]
RARLVDDQTNVQVRLDKVKEAAEQVSGGALQIPDIIQPASPATGPSVTRRLVTWALAGALAAAACTALVLVIRRRRDPRVRARDDLADSVGSSLLAVVRGHPQRSVAGWLTFFETYEAPAEEAWAFRQVLRALVGPPSDSRDPARADSTKQGPGRVEHPHSLSVIALSGDPRAVAVAPQLAVFAASLGITTRLIVATRHDSVAALRAACATDRGSQLRAGLVVDAGGDDDEVAPAPDPSPRPTADAPARPQNGKGNPEARPRGATREAKAMPTRRAVDLTIAFTVADRREPTLDGLPATATTMLAISPGLATREELARLAVAVDDAGHRIDGVVVADRDPADRTTGRRTLDQRAVQAPLPMRMTGPSQVSMPATGRSPAR